MRREGGFTLIEIMVVLAIIAVLAGMVTLLVPIGTERGKSAECMNNLAQIGGMLKIRETAGKLAYRSGAAFPLQIAPQVNDDDLSVFVCPGDPARATAPDLPAPGTPEFVAAYRRLDPKADPPEGICSYAGPDWERSPPRAAGAAARRSRIWACDRCRDGIAHHDGIVVLYDSTKVKRLDVSELEGYDPETGEIVVGPGSPDPRLEGMTFLPAR